MNVGAVDNNEWDLTICKHNAFHFSHARIGIGFRVQIEFTAQLIRTSMHSDPEYLSKLKIWNIQIDGWMNLRIAYHCDNSPRHRRLCPQHDHRYF